MLQFTNDLMAMAIDLTKIIFSDEYRFVLGDDHCWRNSRRGEWNETVFVRSTKFPESVMIWGAIGLDYQSGCFHCSHGIDSDEYQSSFGIEMIAMAPSDGIFRRMGPARRHRERRLISSRRVV
jgi:hypothetical protein